MLVKQKEKMKNVQVGRVLGFSVEGEGRIGVVGQEGAEPGQDEKYVS